MLYVEPAARAPTKMGAPIVARGARRRNAARATRRVQLRGGARRQPARRTCCTLSRLPRAPTKQMGPYRRSSGSGGRGGSGRLEHEKGDLESPGDSELAEHRGQMRLDRALGHGELLGDLLVARSGGELGDDRALPRGEALEPAVDVARARLLSQRFGEGAQLIEQVRGELPPDPDLPVVNRLQGLAEQGRGDPALTVPLRPDLERDQAFLLVRALRRGRRSWSLAVAPGARTRPPFRPAVADRDREGGSQEVGVSGSTGAARDRRPRPRKRPARPPARPCGRSRWSWR